VNAPVSDTFFLRGVAYYEDSSGLVENIVPDGGDSGMNTPCSGAGSLAGYGTLPSISW
jgi:hypothetical protein